MPTTNDDTTDEHWLTSETPADWVDTTHERVYFRDETSMTSPFTPAEELVEAGGTVAEALPGEWTVVITGGSYRGYDVQYRAEFHKQRINLDFYFPRPGFGYLDNIIDEVKDGMDDSPGGETGVNA